MQLLPVSNTSENGTRETRTESSGRNSLDFMKILSDSLSAAPAEVTPTLDIYTNAEASVSQENRDSTNQSDEWQAVDAPYSEPTAPSVPLGAATPVEEIRLTDNELHGVIKSLRENGADEETLSRVAELLGNPAGTPVTEVVKAVANVSAAKLTDGDLQRIGSLADRLDATGQLKASLLDDIKNGRTQLAMARFTDAMNKAMGENSSQKISADKNELLALAKALRIDPKAMESLEKSFGNKDSKTLSLTDFRTLMVPIEEDMAQKDKQQANVAGLLEKALKPAVDKARSRLEKEAEAAGKANRRTDQSEMLIQDTVTRSGINQASGSTLAEKGEKADKAEARLNQMTQTAEAQKKADAAAQNAASKNFQENADAKSQKPAVSVEAEAVSKALDAKAKKAADAKALGLDGKGLDGKVADGKSKEDPWDALLRKLDVRTEASTATAEKAAKPATAAKSDAQPIVGQFNMAQNAQNANTARTANANSAQSARVLSQVEQGVLTAMSDGAKRLTLHLNPVELGAVSVLLTSRNGEVSATLKPERAETAALLNQQVEALRANLEQQGIKVDKVEVQTPQSQNQSNWQGMDQHNASQERQTRQEALERLRRTSRVGDADTQTFTTSAQAMRHAARAGAGAGSLNLVA